MMFALGTGAAVIGYMVLFVSMSLSWYEWPDTGFLGIEMDMGSYHLWDVSPAIAIAIVLCGLALGIFAIVMLTLLIADMLVNVNLDIGKVVSGLLIAGVGAALLGLTLIRVVSPPETGGFIEFSRGIGLWIGLLSALVIAAGSLLDIMGAVFKALANKGTVAEPVMEFVEAGTSEE